MVTILKAKQMCEASSGYNWPNYNDQFILIVPIASDSYTINLDVFKEGSYSDGFDNEVYHEKFAGTLTGSGSYNGKPLYTNYSWQSGEYYERTYTSTQNSYTLEERALGNHPNEYARGRVTQKWEYNNVDLGSVSGTYTSYYYSKQGTQETVRTEWKRHSLINPTEWHDVDIVALKEILKRHRRGILNDHTSKIYSTMYAELCNSIFPLDSNNIANIRDTASTVADIIKSIRSFTSKGKAIKKIFTEDSVADALKKGVLPTLKSGKALTQKASEAWLAYRYAYLTTKLDIEEHRDHLDDAWSIFQNFSNNSVYTRHATASDGNIVYRMKCRIRPKMHTYMQELWVKSKALGLQLNLVNSWDLVPLSFVVDWFLPVENVLEALDNQLLFNDTHFDISIPLVSQKSVDLIDTQWGVVEYSEYYRYFLLMPPLFEPSEKRVSDRTKIYRFIDGVSLIVGTR